MPDSDQKQAYPIREPLGVAEPIRHGPSPGFIVHVQSVKKNFKPPLCLK